uniref:Protein CDV3 homolog n=1 Tax=Panagrellus redivivus TaxID=6233 RepID=A0A7E4WD78_PANRE
MVTESDPLHWSKENVTKKASGSSPKTVTFQSTLPRNKTRQPTAKSSSAKNHKYCSAASMIFFSGSYDDFEHNMQKRVFEDVAYEIGFEYETETDYQDELLQLCESDWCSDSDDFDEEEYALKMELQFTAASSVATTSSKWCPTLYAKQSSLSLSSLRIASQVFPKRKAEPEVAESLPSKRISLSPLIPKKNSFIEVEDEIGYAIKFAGEDLDAAVAKKSSFKRQPSNCFNDSRRPGSEFWNDLDNVAF